MATVQPVQAPPVNVPKGDSTCEISIINTTTDITVPSYYLVQPNIPGHEWLNLPTYSFHITHKPSNTQLVFDLGARKDWQNSVPHIAGLVEGHVNGIRIVKDTHEILEEGGVNLSDVSGVILSHWHFDHTGNPTALPKHIKLYVGPGFKDAFLPGYPAKDDSPFPESDFEGREVVEVAFSNDLKVGKFQAYDFFGDGALYILNVPGHATGHIAALVRTTPDTAIFLGGDTCHITGMVRPSEYIPLPDEIPSNSLDKHYPRPCPCIAFTACHPKQSNARNEPFYHVSTNAASFYHDPPTAEQSIRSLAEFDADPNILLLIAHDTAPLRTLPFFPNGTINNWKEKNFKESMHWGFINELPYEGKTHRGVLVDGLYKDGKKLRGLELPS